MFDLKRMWFLVVTVDVCNLLHIVTCGLIQNSPRIVQFLWLYIPGGKINDVYNSVGYAIINNTVLIRVHEPDMRGEFWGFEVHSDPRNIITSYHTIL